MRALKLLPDYFSYPLWDVDDPDNIDPATLPLSDALRARLDVWAETFDATLNDADPASSGFPSEGARRAFEAEGIGIWHELIAELGPEYSISYYSVMQRRLLPPPDHAGP